MSINVWGTVGGVAGFIPMSALTGAAGQLLGMDATATFAEWKAVKVLGNQLILPAGTVGAPSLSWNDLTTGFYRPAADQVALSIAGTQSWLATATLHLFGKNVQFGALAQENQAADVAAAVGVTDLSAIIGNYVQITNAAGAKAITGWSGATIPAGTEIETKFIITGGSLSLTHDAAAFIILGGASLALQNGDLARWRKISDVAANWEMVGFQRGVSASALTTKGDLLVGLGGGAVDRLAAPPDGSIFVADSTQAKGYSTAPLPAGGSPVAQAVNTALQDSSGYNAAFTTGAGLRPKLLATAVAYALTFGATGLVETFSADVNDPLGADIPALNTSYLFRERAVGWGSTLVPPQYGYAFDRTKGALLNFEGVNGAVVTTDDFGNTWTLTGATISTAQFKFGASSLLLAAGQYAESTNFTTLGDGSWEMSLWWRSTSLAAVNSVITAVNAGGFGVILTVTAAGRINLSLSSNGTSNDIAAASVGAATLVVATWYKIRVVFDALAGTYRVYLSINGAAETQDLTISSSARISALTKIRLGADSAAGTSTIGNIDAFYFLPCSTATFTQNPAAVAPTITDQKVHFYNIPLQQMYEVTAASAVAGTNPTLTAKSKLFVAEADTGIGTISTVRNYAIRGEYVSPLGAIPGTSSSASVNHNIGVKPRDISLILVNLTTINGYVPGDELRLSISSQAGYGSPHMIRSTSISTSFATQASSPLLVTPKAGGDNVSTTAANWNYKIIAKRGW